MHVLAKKEGEPTPSGATGLSSASESFNATDREISKERPTLPGGRIVVGCGGTHVRTSSEIGNVVITGVRARKGVRSVTYETRAHPETAEAIRSSP